MKFVLYYEKFFFFWIIYCEKFRIVILYRKYFIKFFFIFFVILYLINFLKCKSKILCMEKRICFIEKNKVLCMYGV